VSLHASTSCSTVHGIVINDERGGETAAGYCGRCEAEGRRTVGGKSQVRIPRTRPRPSAGCGVRTWPSAMSHGNQPSPSRSSRFLRWHSKRYSCSRTPRRRSPSPIACRGSVDSSPTCRRGPVLGRRRRSLSEELQTIIEAETMAARGYGQAGSAIVRAPSAEPERTTKGPVRGRG